MKKFVESNWKDFGKVDLVMLRNGIFVFNFGDAETKCKAFEQSLWPFMSKVLFLKPWTQDMKVDKEVFKIVLVWVKLPNLKFHYYTAKGLSKLCGFIGKPLFTDKQTSL
ncbi:hypothetical protein ACH5RR_023479 [Cinchona calisaya]|uniref:DUF4283 domain-containing protein n=1 Tax=Cinchona calisaya TaxID=153742 RepID=A0ABD2ZDY1_9GENT